MDQEEERVLYLTRVGREKIFKYGTYNVVQQRQITQDHPYYEVREDMPHVSGYDLTPHGDAQQMTAPAEAEAPQAAPEAAPAQDPPDNPDALASEIISSNFKVGLSQDEVDALLNGMT